MNDTKKDTCEVLYDFGEDFGMLTKQDISTLFVDLHSSISPLDPLNKQTFKERASDDVN